LTAALRQQSFKLLHRDYYYGFLPLPRDDLGSFGPRSPKYFTELGFGGLELPTWTWFCSNN
jgi:hypothetical protein